MPFSEKKGRFLVTCSDESPSGAASPASAAKQRQEKPVKRGRFLITHCLPCVLSPAPSTLSDDGDSLRLLGFAGGPHPRPSECSDSTSSDSSTCKDQQSRDAEVWSSPNCAGQRRRVRFSEPSSHDQAAFCARGPCAVGAAATTAPAAVAAIPGPAAGAASACNPASSNPGLIVESTSLPTPISTRSYCCGRFTVQEAVMTRSLSMPEHCMLAQFMPGGGSSSSLQQHCDGSSSSSSSSSNLSSACDAPAAHGSLLHSSDAAVAAAVVAAASSSYWAATSALDGQQQQPMQHQQQQQPLPQLAGNLSCELYAEEQHALAGNGPHRHRKAPHRSQSVSYFRRGRFIVQTTYA